MGGNRNGEEVPTDIQGPDKDPPARILLAEHKRQTLKLSLLCASEMLLRFSCSRAQTGARLGQKSDQRREHKPSSRAVGVAIKAKHRPLSPSATPQSELGCSHFTICSGCTLDHGLDSPPALQTAAAHFRRLGTEFYLDAGPSQHWRHRARLAVQPGPAGGPPVFGLYRQGSHEAVDIPHCVAHHPAINKAVEVVRECTQACRISAYNEATGQGELRYLQLTVVKPLSSPARSAPPEPATVQLVLVWNSPPGDLAHMPLLAQLASMIWRRAGQLQQSQSSSASCQPLIQSVWVNFQPATFGRGANTILGADWQLLHGPRLAWTRLGGADICFGPGSFLQVNHAAMDRALQAIQGFVPQAAAIVDLHAGVGTIGLSLAATRGPRSVRCVEINPLAEAHFKQSAARLLGQLQHDSRSEAARSIHRGSSSAGGGAHSTDNGGGGSSSSCSAGSSVPKLEYYVAAAGSDPGRWLDGAEVVVVDPPRKGLEPALLRFLASGEAMGPHQGLQRLLYLSCGFPAFMRDCDALLAGGQWRLVHAQGFLFFPGTNHVETLAVFDRVR